MPQKLLTDWTAQVTGGGHELVVSLGHELPKRLGTQQLFVTLKDENQKRIERKELRITGAGTANVTFALPENRDPAMLNLAAFVGKDFQSNLHYIKGSVGSLRRTE